MSSACYYCGAEPHDPSEFCDLDTCKREGCTRLAHMCQSRQPSPPAAVREESSTPRPVASAPMGHSAGGGLLDLLYDIKGDLEYEHPYAKEIIAKVEAALAAVKEPTREMWAAGADAVVGKTSVHHDVVVEAAWRAMTTTTLSSHHSRTGD